MLMNHRSWYGVSIKPRLEILVWPCQYQDGGLFIFIILVYAYHNTFILNNECTDMVVHCFSASGKYFLRTGHKEPFALLAEEHSKVKKSLLLDIFYELV